MFLEITVLAVGGMQVTERAKQVAWQTRQDSFSNIVVHFPIWRNSLSAKMYALWKSLKKK
jgi:hypothetical protein